MLVAVIAAAAIALGAVIAVPLVAHADNVAVSGKVVGPTGKAIANDTVTAYGFFNGATYGTPVTTKTSSTGAFAFAPTTFQSSNQYTLRFAASATTFDQYLGNTSDVKNAQGLYVHAGGGDKEFLSVALSGSGKVSGKVSKLGGGGIAKYTVRAYAEDTAGTWAIAASATTTSSGSYSIASLEPGNYRLEAVDAVGVNPLYEPSFSGSASSLDTATSVTVVAAKTTSYSFTLGKSGSASGIVRGNSGSGAENLAGVVVTAYRLTGPGTWSSAGTDGANSTTTAADGSYRLSGLVPGTYTAEFSPRTTAPRSPSGVQYGRTFLGNEDRASLANEFTIASGTAASNINITLDPAAEWAALIENAGTSVHVGAGVRVEIDHANTAQDQPSNAADAGFTDSSGTVFFNNLAPGDYTLTDADRKPAAAAAARADATGKPTRYTAAAAAV